MIKRIATIASVLAVALLGAGLAWAAIGGSPLASAPDAVAVESTTSVPGDTTTTTDDPGTTTTTEADDPGTTTTTEPGDDGGTTTTTEPEDDEPTTTTMPEDDEPVDIPATTYAAADAGSVTVAVEAGRLVFISADPAAGWSVDEVETGDNEVEVEFTDGDVKVKFEAEFEDGEIKVRVRVDD